MPKQKISAQKISAPGRYDVSQDIPRENPENPANAAAMSPPARLWKKGWRRTVKIRCKQIFQHPLEAIILTILYLILAALPLDLASQCGGFVGRKLGPYLPVTRRARHHLALAFPELSAAEREALLVPMWDNLGRVMAEMPHIGEIAHHRVDAHHTEFIRARCAQGAPMIFMIAHCANWEMTPAWLHSLGITIMGIYRPMNNLIVNQLLLWTRRKWKIPMAEKGAGAARELLVRLKNGESVGSPIDQKLNTGIAVPFFGHAAMTTPLPAKLCYRFNVPMILVLVKRTQGAHFYLEVSPPIWPQDFQAETEAATVLALMTEVNRRLENWIRQSPSQWFWPHRRWPRDTAHPQEKKERH